MKRDCLIDTISLRTAMRSEKAPHILDCRARLESAQAGQQLWEAGHIPGSVHFDLDRDMSDRPGEDGRHPLPSKAAFTRTVQRLGLSASVPVVVYDDRGGQLAAARAWWMLACWAGHPDVRVLDGGFPAWLDAGGETAVERLPAEHSPVPPGDWQPTFDDKALADAEGTADASVMKIDARSPERFRGENEPIDAVAGHIPGAMCRPSSANLTEQGTFKTPQQLDAELPGSDHVVSYCGSGITACHNVLAYAIAGRPLPRLYAGSWSHWIRDPARPVATGN
jgi:thiosulfate/3-mercaptopyruvate sulfurtransferase